ncbi:MAG: hypothetical protein ABSE92_07700 [Terriglobales bacterium]|jgi:hypothetical protein
MDMSFARQAFSFVGAMLILVAYVGQQLKWMDSEKPAYNILNIVGSAILVYVAFHPFQLGFVVLEGAWVVVSMYALTRSAQS